MKFDLKKLKRVLNADTSELLNSPQNFWKFNFTKGNRYLFVDRGAKLLAVAHLDTVADIQWKRKSYDEINKVSIDEVGVDDTLITSIALDDRLGVFFLMDVLPYLGLEYDILLTTDEEVGRSTAGNFMTKKKYNWMFEFDRRGYGTAVLYQYDTKDIKDALTALDYKIEQGSFSDIAYLEDLGCVGINFGTGYVNEHTSHCSTRTSWMNVSINMFVDFYHAYRNTHFIFDAPVYSRYSTYRYDDYGYNYSYGKNSWDTKTYSSSKTTKPVATVTPVKAVTPLVSKPVNKIVEDKNNKHLTVSPWGTRATQQFKRGALMYMMDKDSYTWNEYGQEVMAWSVKERNVIQKEHISAEALINVSSKVDKSKIVGYIKEGDWYEPLVEDETGALILANDLYADIEGYKFEKLSDIEDMDYIDGVMSIEELADIEELEDIQDYPIIEDDRSKNPDMYLYPEDFIDSE